MRPVRLDDFTLSCQDQAMAMALAVNGGSWEVDYTESQKIGWCLKVRWAHKRFTGSDI